MSKELVIGSNRHETKVAILEEDQLVEVYFQRGNEYSLAGSIHKGRVTRVLPGMQSAFVDLGLERDTFLYVSDFFEENEDIDAVVDEKPQPSERGERDRRDRDRGDRDRGDRDRGGFRGGNRPSAQERTEDRNPEPRESPVSAEAATVEPLTVEDEGGIPTGEIAASAVVTEPRPNERENRDFRGDRRNRRSRRRRPRPQGFPENKYAQSPGATPLQASGRSRARLRNRRGRRGNSGCNHPSGGISRQVPAQRWAPERQPHSENQESRQASSEAEMREQASISPDAEPLPGPATDPEEREAIEDEAESLELTEKIFSHHDDESVEEVEEKIEEVKNDQPVPPASLNEDLPESSEFNPAPPLSTAAGPGLTETPFSEIPQVSSEIGTEPLPELPRGEVVEVDEFDMVEMDDPGDGAPEELSSSGQVEPQQGETGSQPQTATVREQGGRYMHRASRRMRRRRGGNRFSQGPEAVSRAAGPASAAPPNAGIAAGTAAALDPESDREDRGERSSEKPERVMPSIADLLKAGQEIIVQIAKEPLGQKGARITSHVALPGRYVVFMPGVNHVGVSRKIASDEERQRLKRILQTHRVGTTGGFIVRTAGEGVPEDEIAADMNFLYSLWLDIRQKAEKRPAPALLHYDLDIVQRILRDQVTEEFKAIWVDNEELYENVLTFIQRFQPALVGRVKMYTRSAPIFDAFNITQELEKALRPKVWLKSGGYIVINQTEALVAIDINTGKYVGKSNRLEDTIVKTNTEAVKEIVRQIRLRDLGGIIVVDFIDMDERKNRQKVMQALEEAMRADKAPYKILQFNDFGLVAITRKRVKQSLERTLCSPCPYCEGAGYVKSVQTVIGEILTEAQKIARAIEGKDVMLRANPEVAKVLKASNNRYLEELEQILGRPVLVTADATLHQDKFDLA